MSTYANTATDNDKMAEPTAKTVAVPRTAQRWKRLTLAAVGICALAVSGTGVYWSLQPASFDVRAVALERVDGDESRLVPGAVAASAVGQVARTLREKPGGYLHNDFQARRS